MFALLGIVCFLRQRCALGGLSILRPPRLHCELVSLTLSLTEEKIAELTWHYLSAESFETTRVSLATKAAVARLIGTDGTQEVNLAQCRPQHIRKVELTVHALPKKKT